MGYTREQRAANAAKAAEAAARALPQGSDTSVEPSGDPEPKPKKFIASASEGEERPQREIVRGNKDRAAAMEEIVNRGNPQAEETPEAPKEVKAAPEAAAPTDDTPAALPLPETVKMAKVKVDGEEFEVSQAEIDEAGGVSAYQRLRAADNRLKKAHEVLEEAKRFRAQSAPPPAPVVPTVSDDEFIQKKMDDIRFGDPAVAAAALREVMNRANPRVDENLLITKTNSTINHDIAKNKFMADYQDVIANPVLVRLVPGLVQEALSPYIKNGQPDWSQLGTLDWNKLYAKVGNTIRNAVPRASQPQPVAVPTGTPIPAQADKEARKASIVNLPTAAARAALPEEEKPETREQMLEGMRKARKQTM